MISKLTGTIDRVVYDHNTKTITVSGNNVPEQTIEGYQVEDWYPVNDPDGLPILDFQLWDESSKEYPDEYGFQYASLKFNELTEYIEQDEYYSIEDKNQITFENYKLGQFWDEDENDVFSTDTIGWRTLSVNGKPVKYLVKIENGILTLSPDQKQLNRLAPKGTVMEFHNEALSITPFTK